MSDVIVVRGIRAEGRHGILADGEREKPQPFFVDVELLRDLRPVAEMDDLGATADYIEIAKTVREVIEQESFELLEKLADAIAMRVATFAGASVRVKVSKPSAAAMAGVDEIAVVVERG